MLVVDDSPVMRALLERHFIATGHDVITASDGEDALALARQDPPDVMLLDIEMPGVSGLDVLVRLNADSEPLDFPVIVLTATDDDATTARALRAGAQDYVLKSPRWDVLDARVAVAVRLKRRRDELRGANGELALLAWTDGLTGLANRRCGELRLAEALAGPHTDQVQVLLVDVDQFKGVNDRHGHATADRVLRRVGAILSSRLRVHDLVSRWGGDEFLLILRSCGTEDAVAVANAIRTRVARDPELRPLGITISVGVASGPTEGAEADELVAAADVALYRAKRSGRDRIHVAVAGQSTASTP